MNFLLFIPIPNGVGGESAVYRDRRKERPGEQGQLVVLFQRVAHYQEFGERPVELVLSRFQWIIHSRKPSKDK